VKVGVSPICHTWSGSPHKDQGSRQFVAADGKKDWATSGQICLHGRKSLSEHTVLWITVATTPLIFDTSPAVAAQENEGGVAEIVMTAQKREQNLIDVPSAISAFRVINYRSWAFKTRRKYAAVPITPTIRAH
jgi:hypothetical protein